MICMDKVNVFLHPTTELCVGSFLCTEKNKTTSFVLGLWHVQTLIAFFPLLFELHVQNSCGNVTFLA